MSGGGGSVAGWSLRPWRGCWPGLLRAAERRGAAGGPSALGLPAHLRTSGACEGTTMRMEQRRQRSCPHLHSTLTPLQSQRPMPVPHSGSAPRGRPTAPRCASSSAAARPAGRPAARASRGATPPRPRRCRAAGRSGGRFRGRAAVGVCATATTTRARQRRRGQRPSERPGAAPPDLLTRMSSPSR